MSTSNQNISTQSRWKSWALWVSVLGLAGLICQSVGLFDKIGLDTDEWDMIITSLGCVLTAFGIVNNPTDSENI